MKPTNETTQTNIPKEVRAHWEVGHDKFAHIDDLVADPKLAAEAVRYRQAVVVVTKVLRNKLPSILDANRVHYLQQVVEDAEAERSELLSILAAKGVDVRKLGLAPGR